MNDQAAQTSDETPIDRRKLLRRGGAAVVVGLAGLGVAEVVSAGPASAASGDPLTLGAANDSGVDLTTLTTDADGGPTLEIGNTGQGAALRLTQVDYPTNDDLVVGSGDMSNYEGDLYFGTPYDDEGDAYPALVYTEANASQIITIISQRVLDTRSASGRKNIKTTSKLLNKEGQVLAGKTITIKLDNYVVLPGAVLGNLTAVDPASGGYAQLFAGGTRPLGSSVNFAAKQTVANFAVTGATFDSDTGSTTVSIYCSATTHVILDITAFSVGSADQINPDYLPNTETTALSAKLAAHARAGRLPSWYQAAH